MAAKCAKHCQYHRYRHTPKPSQNSITPTCNEKIRLKEGIITTPTTSRIPAAQPHVHMQQKVVKKNTFLRLPCTPNGSSHGGHPKKSLPTTPEELTAGFSFERAIDFIKVAKTLMIPPASLQTLLPIHCSIFAGISTYFSEIYLKK